MGPEQNSLVVKDLEALVTARWCKPNRAGKLLVGGPSIVRQETQKGDVCSVKVAVAAQFSNSIRLILICHNFICYSA